MNEIILTSSVMILALILLRAIFRKRVSHCLIYGMWLLVALRLLIPVQFGSFRFGILSQTKPVTEVITEAARNPISGPSREEVYQRVITDYIYSGHTVFIPDVQTELEQQLIQNDRPVEEIYQQVIKEHEGQDIVLPGVQDRLETDVSHAITAPTLGQAAVVVWIVGMIAMAIWFLYINIAFHRNLKRTAKAMEVPDCPVTVKVDGYLSSPCLFGIVKPTIYLTPICTEDSQIRCHVLTHELTHLHHADHIWALIRCLCLCIYWFNPLVWVAAGLSKRDCELACDESVIKKLGEQERLAYGKTLVDMVANSVSPRRFLETATAMHETKEQLKERVNCIVKKPKIILAAAICLALAAVIITGCAFAGYGDAPEQSIEEEIIEAYYNTVEDDAFREHYTTADLSLRFRGAFSDTYVVFVDGPYGYGQIETGETVGGIKFRYCDSHHPYAYHQGKFYSLSEAYALGYLTLDDLMQLKEDYPDSYGENSISSITNKGEVPTTRQPCTHTTPPNAEITIDEEIRQAYANLDTSEDYTAEDLSVRYRGAFNDLYVVFVDGPFEHGDLDWTETVAGVSFEYHSTQTMYAYHQGRFHTLQEAYDLGLMTKDELLALKEAYDNTDHSSQGTIPTVREACKHTKNSKPVDSTLLMPDIPSSVGLCSKPDVLSAETLVSTIYDYSIFWEAGDGNAFTCSVRLPAITPFSTDAIAINEAIRQTFQYRVQAARYSFDQKSTPSFKSIHYTTYLYNHVLTVQITQEDYAGLALNSTWMLDVSTGKNVTTAELAKQHLDESYPAFLQHRTHDLIEYYKANPLDNADDQAKFLQNLAFDTFAMHSNTLYLSSDGTLMLTFHVHDANQTFTLPYANMDIYGFESTGEDAYHWLFHLQTDGAYADEWSAILKECFFLAPQEFVSMLSKEENATIARIASSINYALHPSEESESYRTLCESIRDLSANKQHSETAQILLNAINPL